jgi:hypothetical protein
MTIHDVLQALDNEEIFLDELLSAIADTNETPANGRWFVRTLLDQLHTSALRAEITFREGGRNAVDPFHP